MKRGQDFVQNSEPEAFRDGSKAQLRRALFLPASQIPSKLVFWPCHCLINVNIDIYFVALCTLLSRRVLKPKQGSRTMGVRQAWTHRPHSTCTADDPLATRRRFGLQSLCLHAATAELQKVAASSNFPLSLHANCLMRRRKSKAFLPCPSRVCPHWEFLHFSPKHENESLFDVVHSCMTSFLRYFFFFYSFFLLILYGEAVYAALPVSALQSLLA